MELKYEREGTADGNMWLPEDFGDRQRPHCHVARLLVLPVVAEYPRQLAQRSLQNEHSQLRRGGLCGVSRVGGVCWWTVEMWVIREQSVPPFSNPRSRTPNLVGRRVGRRCSLLPAWRSARMQSWHPTSPAVRAVYDVRPT